MNIQILLNEFCSYSRYIKGLSESTIRRYTENINFFIKTMEIKSIADIHQENVSAFFEYGRVTRSWLNWCVSNEYLETNFADEIETPKVKVTPRRKFSQLESQRILIAVENYPFSSNFLSTRNIAILTLFLYTGLRKHELLNLKTNDIDLMNQILSVNTAKRNSFRTIPIPLKLNKILHEYSVQRNLKRKTCPEFFCSYHRNMGFTDSGLKRLLTKISSASGIHITSHILRHTFATLMLEGGCDIFSLSRMMGHKDIQTTCIYLTATKHHLQKQMMSHPLL
jgi:site-specific recombinase XerD